MNGGKKVLFISYDGMADTLDEIRKGAVEPYSLTSAIEKYIKIYGSILQQ